MNRLERARFDHWGIPTEQPQEGEKWLPTTRVWVTNPRNHPAHVEFLRYEADSPVTELRRTQPHIAFRVENLQEALEGLTVLTGPTTVSGGLASLAFAHVDGVVVELIEWADANYAGWFGD